MIIVMEIIDYNLIMSISRDITLKALDKDLIPTNDKDISETAQNIAQFYGELSDALSNLKN